MSCNCSNINPCPTADACLCGVDISLYEGGSKVYEVQTGGYIGDDGLFFELTGTNPLYKIRYDSDKKRWELYYFDDTYDTDIVVGVYYTENGCPTSMCDWDLDCISFIFRPRLISYVVTWEGEWLNGRKLYRSSLPYTPGPIIYDWTFYWSSENNRWEMSREYGGIITIGYSDIDTVCIPTEGPWNQEGGGVTTYATFPVPYDLTGYEMKVSAIECGCCDTTLSLVISHEDIDGGNAFNVYANIVTDLNGNVLGVNGKTYYKFILTIGSVDYTYYLAYNGIVWIVTDDVSSTSLGAQYTYSDRGGDCPFGFYRVDKPFNSFWVTGSECFDCCNYYTPRFSNFIKKKKYDLVSDITDIKAKEIFGMKCGPEWSDLFRKHLILNVLHCLPYGVLCDEEEQCLINNVNENCNC